MAFLDSAFVRNALAQGFNGQLSKGVLRREASSTVNNYGDRVVASVQSFPFQGTRDTFNAAFAAQAGIPDTDVRILFIAGLIKTVPRQDDKVFIKNQWFQLRKLVETDPAEGHYVFAGFEIKAPG